MFTGIIEEVGKIKSANQASNFVRLTISCQKVLEDLKIGDSVATNGVCLTVTDLARDSFSADVMHETMKRSSLAHLKRNAPVNLERALLANGRLDGHMVSGHIDGMGQIKKISKDGIALLFTISCDEKLCHFMVEKGSVALDGISLTLVEVKKEDFQVSVIPHSMENTNFLVKKVGDSVNIECDLIGKYIVKALKKKSQGISKEFLAQNGYF